MGTLARQSTPVDWAPARGLVAYYSFDSDLAPQDCGAARGEERATIRSPQRNGNERWCPEPGPAESGRRRVSTARTSSIRRRHRRLRQLRCWTGRARRERSHGHLRRRLHDGRVDYPTAPNGAIVTRDEDIVEPNGHGLNLRDGKIEYDYVTKWVDEGIRLRTRKRSP